MKIAITGATGFFGRYLTEALSSEETYLFGRALERLIKTYPAVEGKRLIETDYSIENLKSNLQNTDVVIHLAAMKYSKDRTSLSDYKDNLHISENLLKACNQLNISNFVFASTRLMYSDKFNKIPFLENEDVFPQNLYALSKLMVEKLGLMYENICFKALRFSQIVGWGEREGYMLATFLSRALKKESLTVFGEGKGERDYLYAKDAANAIIAAMRKPNVKGVFNIGLGKGTSHREFAETINKVFADGKAKILFDKSQPEDSSVVCMSIAKTKEVMGWRPAYSLEEAFQDMKVEHDKNH